MKFLKSLIAPILAALLAAGAAQGAFFQWSTTANNNATADPTINWSEGMSPSSVNDSARAMMARAAEYRNDVAGAITTGGTSTAYTVTTNQVFTTLALMSGNKVAFVPHATNGGTVTLNVDGLGAKPLRTSPGVEVAAGVLVAGTPYVATYNNSAAVWYLQNYYANPFEVPLGTALDYSGTTAPNSNFVLAYGQCISRTTYSAYFSLVGTTFGACDGSTTFGVPDLRGRAVFGKDNMGGSAAGRIGNIVAGSFSGTSLGAAGGEEAHTLSTSTMPSHTHSGTTATEASHTHGVSIASDPGSAHAHAISNTTDTANASHDHTVPIQTRSIATGSGFAVDVYVPSGGSATTITSSTAAANHSHGLSLTTATEASHTHVVSGTSASGSAHSHTFTTGATGSGGAHNNMPPGIILNKIIRIF